MAESDIDMELEDLAGNGQEGDKECTKSERLKRKGKGNIV